MNSNLAHHVVCRWSVWGPAAMLLFLAACAAPPQPIPTSAPQPTPSPTETEGVAPTRRATATAVPAEPTRPSAGPSGEPAYVLPVKGVEDAPVTIIEFSDFL